MDLYIAGFWILLVALSLLSWSWRDRDAQGRTKPRQPELQVAGLFWIAAVLTVALRPSLATRFHLLEPSLLLIDAGLFAGLAWVGVRSGRGWVLCAAALQLISAAAHVARLATPGMWRLGYQVMEEASSYPVLLLLGWGVLTHRAATRREGRSARSYSPSVRRSRTR